MSDQCRICLENNMESSVVLTKIFDKKSILQTLSEWASIEILDQDPLPKCICQCCFKKFESFHEFCQMIVESDSKLKELVFNSEFDSQIDIKTESDLENSKNTIIANVDVKIEPLHEIVNELNDASASEFKLKQEEETEKTIKRKTRKKIHECKDCNKVFKKSYDYRIHNMRIHTGEKKYACEFCPKKFAKKNLLVYHRRTHTGEKPFTCKVCSKSFCSPSGLFMHKKLHNKEKKYKCTTCDESFTRSENLKVHVRIHTGEKPYLCEICSSAFRSHNSLRTHKRGHLKKEVCPICHNLYGANELKKHIQRHKDREQGIKRFVCEHCGKRFTGSSSRTEHLRIHSGEKPYSCKTCGKSFTQNSTLKNHFRVHCEVLIPCKYCTKSFRYKQLLYRHVAAHHNDVAIECLEDS